MTRITLDEATLALIRDGGGFAQVCDPQGRFVAEIRAYEKPVSLKDMDPGVSQEELDRRAGQGGGRTLAEIVQDLESRG